MSRDDPPFVFVCQNCTGESCTVVSITTDGGEPCLPRWCPFITGLKVEWRRLV